MTLQWFVADRGSFRVIVKTFIKEDRYPPPWTSSGDNSHVYYANDTDMLEGRFCQAHLDLHFSKA